jgi:hypothetical protein
LAIYNGHILDVHFPLLVYKKLQGEPVGLEDLPQINPVRFCFVKVFLSVLPIHINTVHPPLTTGIGQRFEATACLRRKCCGSV